MILRGPSRPDLLRDECLCDILLATARRRPNHPALIDGRRVVTYGQLSALSNALAGALTHRGAGAGQIVGLFMPRGADLLIAQAGISKSRAAWLPFDAETPLQRIETCLRSAGALGLVTCRAWLPRLGDMPVPVWAVEDLLDENGKRKAESGEEMAGGGWRVADGGSQGPRFPLSAFRSPDPSDPAYVIYTSGSTGQPKGIVVSHRSICHFLRSENEVLGVREDDRVYQGFSVAFDMSFEEIWISYLVGATLWIAPADSVGDPDRVAQAVARHGITVLHAVPTLMGLIDDPLPTVRLINLGGEACPEALVGRLARPGRELVNTYGPTEATVSATLARLEPGRPVTIGTPLPNYGLMVVDHERRPLPAGETGELGIIGPGLAVGYLGRPELTAERFVANPLAAEPHEARLYLTGDLGRIEPGGPVHCLGRADGQVKIRGFRVELGEIEAAVAAQPGVAAAAVAMRPMAEIDQMVGFVVAAPGRAVEPGELRRALSSRLPPYMVPAHFEVVSQLPRLTSGKVDRNALGTLPLSNADGNGHDHHVAPRNEDEAALYAAMGRLFPGRGLRPDADFFDDLGGHSLLAARLVSLLRTDPQYAAMSVGDVYRGRRLEAIAVAMNDRRRAKRPAAASPRVAVPWQRRVLCGAVQAMVIPVLVLLHIADWLAPFFVYHYFTGDEGDSIWLAAFYSVAAFVAAEVATFGVAIAGKWLLAGRVKAGRYPLWGVTYFRSWLADRLCELPPVYLLTGTPLLNWYLRAMGARIGRDVLIDSVSVREPDLLCVESGASVGTAVHFENARVERGELVLGPVRLGRDAVVDSYAVLESDTAVGAGARLGGLSALAAGRCIPAGEIWEGAPARRVDRVLEPVPPRPQVGLAARWAQLAFFAVAGMTIAALFFMTVFPCFMLIDWLDGQFWDVFENDVHPIYAFGLFFLLGIPASMVLVLATVLLAGGFRRVFLPRQKAGLWPVHGVAYCRKWLLTRVLDSSLGVLHGLYASVFAPAWLRLMGAKVGRGAEVSTATGIVPDLLSLGEHSFIADGAMLGDEEQRGGWMVLRPTAIGNRSFVGNGAYVADGAAVPDDVLIGVQTRTPDNDQLRSGQTWIGSPPLLLPARECLTGFDPSLTFHPSRTRRVGRGVVEALRIVLPLAFVIAAGYLIVQMVMPLAEEEQWLSMAAALALAGCVFGLASFLLVVGLKWILVGRYRPRAAPMWTPFVWLSEAVTNLYESLAVPNLLEFLRGTPILPWALRLLGAHMGKGIYLDTTDLTEFDCVTVGDEAELNAWCGPQTHLFEDRVMKIGLVEIGAGVTVGACSTILYDTQIGDGVQLGPLTLVAKGERLPARTRWEGSPAAPVDGE
jgi:non-ribosomal peptide synthetase-like protein